MNNKMDLTRRGVLQTTNLLAAGTMSLGEAALAELAESPFSIQSTQVKRVRFRSRRSFDEVLQRLHQLVPAAITPEQYRAAMAKAGGREGVTVIYDLPSSLMVTHENPPLLEAAAALDAKLQDLVTEVTSGS